MVFFAKKEYIPVEINWEIKLQGHNFAIFLIRNFTFSVVVVFVVV